MRERRVVSDRTERLLAEVKCACYYSKERDEKGGGMERTGWNDQGGAKKQEKCPKMEKSKSRPSYSISYFRKVGLVATFSQFYALFRPPGTISYSP